MSGPCDRATLVEAMVDGRLGPSERASTERHLKLCSSCAELVRELSALQDLLRESTSPSSPLEHQRARLALLHHAAGTSAKPRRPALLLAVMLTLTLPLAVWAAASSFPRLRSWSTSEATLTRPTRRTPAAESKHAPRLPPADSPAAPETARSLLSSPSASPRVSVPPAIVSSPNAERRRPSQASRDFAAAMQTLSRGDFSAGASRLRGFAVAHPRDPRVEDAAYLEAIALERAGRLADAQAAARRYLASYPEGAHRSQARRIAGN